MPTGWRPADVKDKYPVPVVEDVFNFRRYETPASPLLKGYAIFQTLATLFFLLFMFYNYSNIGFDGLLLFGTFVFVGIYGYTTLMDRDRMAVWIEVLRGLGGLAFIGFTGDWFGMADYLSWGVWLVAGYFLLTIFGGIYFTYLEKRMITGTLTA
jgi:hypothetical protein